MMGLQGAVPAPTSKTCGAKAVDALVTPLMRQTMPSSPRTFPQWPWQSAGTSSGRHWTHPAWLRDCVMT